MKNRFFTVVLLLGLLLGLTGNSWTTQAASQDATALVFVKIGSADDFSRFASTGLPLYSRLEKGLLSGADKAGAQALQGAGLSYQVLDQNLKSGSYYLAQAMPGRVAPDFARFGSILLSMGSNSVLLRMNPDQVQPLSLAGAELQAITLIPKPLPVTQSKNIFPQAIDPDPIIRGMMDQVTREQVSRYDRQLAGELPVWVDGVWYTITTRHTYSGTPIQKATHYVGQHIANDLEMDVEYHVWNSTTNPNVIGEIPGLLNPDDIFVIGAHIDDVNGTPGADDNASGSVATLIAADILSQYQWSCTLRFAFWTGEEQGLLGSHAYAQRAYNQGENILGYLNLDMIAWNSLGSSQTIYLGYDAYNPPSHDLALLFEDVIGAYNINLIPSIGTAYSHSSDHGSFNDYGFPAVLGIEGDDDFNPYYHGPGDTPAHTNLIYFTTFVKASIATYAHMSNCLIPETKGVLNGRITAAASGTPLGNASITAEDADGNTYPTITNPAGYYAMALPSDTYTVTASMNGYVTQTKNVSIVGRQVTTLDFALQPACVPVNSTDFSWLPAEPFNGETMAFTATASGTTPIEFHWLFGDGDTGSGSTVEHVYTDAGPYTVSLTSSNDCGTQTVSKNMTILQTIWQFFLSLVNRG